MEEDGDQRIIIVGAAEANPSQEKYPTNRRRPKALVNRRAGDTRHGFRDGAGVLYGDHCEGRIGWGMIISPADALLGRSFL
jgi:hypothetical protein